MKPRIAKLKPASVTLFMRQRIRPSVTFNFEATGGGGGGEEGHAPCRVRFLTNETALIFFQGNECSASLLEKLCHPLNPDAKEYWF